VRDGKSISTSLSIGVAEYKKDEAVESLIRRVDQALYAAKKGGRGRIAKADPPAGPDS
jgi:PleD family two-component response regulator